MRQRKPRRDAIQFSAQAVEIHQDPVVGDIEMQEGVDLERAARDEAVLLGQLIAEVRALNAAVTRIERAQEQLSREQATRMAALESRLDALEAERNKLAGKRDVIAGFMVAAGVVLTKIYDWWTAHGGG